MCGISGIVAREAKRYQKHVQDMNQSLHHRGPDASGILARDNAIFGHTRLSIVDIEGGAQPMPARGGALMVSFNGEIYGYLDIKKKIGDYEFRTNSDTELILALYEKYGTAMMDKLPGMFAFSIWDENNSQLFAARDRFGEKPYYYAFGRNGEFIFASEIKAILNSELIDPVISHKSLDFYLRRGFVPKDLTIYENIHTLPPAHSLLYKEGKLKIERYWSIPKNNFSGGLDEASIEFKDLLKSAVDKYLIADVEIGSFLSGGLDSTTIVHLASRLNPGIKSYSFGFSGSRSELEFSRAASSLYDVSYEELSEAGKLDLHEMLMKMQSVYDEPFADTSNIPTYMICKLARSYGKVVLTGDGADELLGGYPWYHAVSGIFEEKQTPAAMLPVFFAAGLSEKALELMLSVSGVDSTARRYWRDRYTRLKHSRSAQSHFNFYQEYRSTNLSDKLISDWDIANQYEHLASWELTDSMEDVFRTDMEQYMSSDILVKIDRASMAHGLELRAPFLDVDFAGFCLTLPSEFKISSESDKIILREAFSSEWPESIRNRSKQGFDAAVYNWLKDESVENLIKEHFENPNHSMYKVLSRDQVSKCLKDEGTIKWRLLIFALWADRHNFSLN